MNRFEVVRLAVLVWLVATEAGLGQWASPPVPQVTMNCVPLDSLSGRFYVDVEIKSPSRCQNLKVLMYDLGRVVAESPLVYDVVPRPTEPTRLRFTLRLTDPASGFFRYRVFCGVEEIVSRFMSVQRIESGLEFVEIPKELAVTSGPPPSGGDLRSDGRPHGWFGGVPQVLEEFRAVPGSARQFSIDFRFVQDTLCDTLKAFIADLKNVSITGPERQSRSGRASKEVRFHFPGQLVSSDTGLFTYSTWYGPGGGEIKSHLISVYSHSDSLVFYFGNIYERAEAQWRVSEQKRQWRLKHEADSVRHVGDSLLESKYAPDGSWWIGLDDQGHPVPMTKEEFEAKYGSEPKPKPREQPAVSPPEPGPHVWPSDWKPQQDAEPTAEERYQAQLAEMRELEKTPLEGVILQHFMLGDTLYERSNGESKFRIAKPYRFKDPDQPVDSAYLIRLRSELRYDVILDLRDPTHYKLMRGLIDSMIATEQPGFYRVLTSKQVMERIEAEGIKWTRPERLPAPDQVKKSKPQGTLPRKEQTAGITAIDTVFFAGAEIGGIDTWWWYQDVFAFAGANDYWCTAYPGGDTWVFYHYDNNMAAIRACSSTPSSSTTPV